MNYEAILYILKEDRPIPEIPDRWTLRSHRNRERNFAFLRHMQGYARIDRYGKAVREIDRLLEIASKPFGARLSLCDYSEDSRSPLKSKDLIDAFQNPETSLFYPYFSARLTELLEGRRYNCAGISISFQSQALPAFTLAGCLKQIDPTLKIILGGSLITSWMKSPFWKDRFSGIIDSCIAGPGEQPLLKLFGKEASLAFYRPDYSDFRANRYLSPLAILPYSASQGCMWSRCTFCPETAEKAGYAAQKKETIFSDIAHLRDAMHPGLIHMLDNEMSLALLGALMDHPPGIPWYGFCRFFKELEDPAFCTDLRKAGCIMLKLGLESGDENVLSRMNKGIGLESASKAIGNLRRAGIGTYLYLLFGTPSEGFEEAMKTLEFIAARSEDIDFLNLALFNLPAGSPEATSLKTSDFYDADLSLYKEFEHPKGWNRDKVRKFLDTQFKRHPAIAPIVRRMPPFFGSNHAPFFLMNRDG